MSEKLPTRRSFLATSAAAGLATTVGASAGGLLSTQSAAAATTSASSAVRPFRIHVPQADLLDLRGRVRSTRWPAVETVADQSQGVKLAKLQELTHYWGTRSTGGRSSGNSMPSRSSSLRSMDSTSTSRTFDRVMLMRYR